MVSSEYTAGGGAAAQAATMREMKTLRLVVDPARLESCRGRGGAGAGGRDFARRRIGGAADGDSLRAGRECAGRGGCGEDFRGQGAAVVGSGNCACCRAAMLEGLVQEVPEAARKLMKAFWPGPLTLLLPRTAAVPDAVTAGRPLVGVRMPAHPVALELIRRAGVPVAAPSANLFGHTSPTTAAHVLDGPGWTHRCGAGCGADRARGRVHGAGPMPEPDGDLPAGSGDERADSSRSPGRWRVFEATRRWKRSRARRCPRRGWGCGIMRPGRGWC